MYDTRTIFLATESQRQAAIAAISNAPAGVEVVIREKPKKRTREQNAYAWAGMIKDFETQGWVDGRSFSGEVWHDYLKREHLPETPEEGITLRGYRKWDEAPDGRRVLVGSTTKLTVRGYAEYLTRCMAWGSQELGIMFTVQDRYVPQ